jgi:hypothetical protein
MKLVLSYNVTDGYSYDHDIILPFEYQSEEAALCDLEVLVIAHQRADQEFKFVGVAMNSEPFGYRREDGSFCFCGANIQTLEDWFESNKNKVV